MWRSEDSRLRGKAFVRKIKDFLLQEQSREVLIFLFFFVVSGGFWLLQTLKDDYETELTLPLRLKNVPNDVVLTSEPPSEVRVIVQDKGTALVNYWASKTFYPLVIDFEAYQGRSNQVRILSKELEKKITSQLDASTKLLAIRPDTLEYIYTRGKAKKLPVRLCGHVSTTPLYYLTDTIYTPDSVVAYAPQPMLDTLRWADTEEVRWEDLEDTTRVKLAIRPIKGVKFIPSQVGVELPVDIITEKTLEVPLVGVGFPANCVLRSFPSKVQVTFHVGLNHFKQIQADDFVLQAPYQELLNNPSGKFRVRVTAYPKGVSHIRVTPREVDYLIEQVPGYGN